MMTAVRLVWELGAQLGEGPLWCADEQALWFVDIKGGAVHRYASDTEDRQSFAVGGMPSFIVPGADGDFLVGSRNALFRFEGGKVGRSIATINMPAHNRTNDATVDHAGRLWLGTMDDNESLETGQLYCLDRGVLHPMRAKAIVTNGPAVSQDGRILYFVDSVRRQIWRYPIVEGPHLGEADLFLQLGPDDGHPDGIVLDSEDCLWVALWDGWAVRRYAPDGTLLLQVNFPCARVTKIAFGGADLKTAYVTTARIGLDEAMLEQQPLAGSLFDFEAPAAGRLLPRYGQAVPA